MSAATPNHRPAPSPISSEIVRSLQNLTALTEAFDAYDSRTSTVRPSRPQSARATPRPPTSARRLVLTRSAARPVGEHNAARPADPKQAFVVQHASASHQRPAREMGVSEVKIPYSVPWYRPQLDETIEELERCKQEVRRLKGVVASIAKERDAALETGRRCTEIIQQKSEENKALVGQLEVAEEDAARANHLADATRRERELIQVDNAKLRTRITTLTSELEDVKTAMGTYLEDRIKAERSSAEAAALAAQAGQDARMALNDKERLAQERDAVRRKLEEADQADERRAAAARAAAERAEAERRARLEARVIDVKPETREALLKRADKVATHTEVRRRASLERTISTHPQ